MKKACIVICYYGEFPKTFNTFLSTCRNNLDFDWLIVSDSNSILDEYSFPTNVKYKKMLIEEIEERFCLKTKLNVKIKSPYKLCDYKVAYGLIFDDELKDYCFWGYGDLDVLYGNLTSFVDDSILKNYDKIFPLGHLSLIRNNDVCNRAFMMESTDTFSWKKVYQCENTFGWDEHNGINLKMEAMGLKVYYAIPFIDRPKIYDRFKTVQRKELYAYFGESWISKMVFLKNYKYQFFGTYNGKAYQFYYVGNTLEKKEVAYIHYRKKYNDCLGPNFICYKNMISNSILEFSLSKELNKKDKFESFKTLKLIFTKKLKRIVQTIRKC